MNSSTFLLASEALKHQNAEPKPGGAWWRKPLLTSALVVLCALAQAPLQAAPLPKEGRLVEWVQRDGTRVSLKVFGDEFYARTTTKDGYTVLFNEADKTYYYATTGPEGALVATTTPAGRPAPAGLVKGLQEPAATVAAVRAQNVALYAPDRAANWAARVRAVQASRAQAQGLQAESLSPAEAAMGVPMTGNKVGLVVLVQFPDDPATPAADAVSFPATQAKMIRYCNEVGYTDDGNTGSIRDYFHDQSGGLLTHTQVVSTIVTLPHPRNYYNYSDYPANTTMPSSGTAGRLMLADAIAKLKTDGFDFSTLSLDASNRVYATSLLFAGPDSGVWAKGLWPHAFSATSPISVGTAGNPRSIFRYQCTDVETAAPVIGTVCHELGHLLLSYPDLYDTDSSDGNSAGVGQHCLMGSGNHLNGGKTPGPIGLYLKDYSGWANITDLTPGQALSTSLATTGNVGYRIRKPGTATEYFLVENRGAGDKWANSSPDKGIMIWHIDEAVTTDNRRQQMTPSQHYEVSVEQADGAFDLENNRDRGDNADLFDSTTGLFNNTTTPNADWWSGVASNIAITVQSAPGASMNLTFGSSATGAVTLDPPTLSAAPTAGPQSFTVTTTLAWSWTVDSAWVTSNEAANQTGNQTFSYNLAANPGATSRTAVITITATGGIVRTHTITQEGLVLDDHGNNIASATVVGQESTTPGEIETAADSDYFRINVTGSGPLVVETTGATDTYGTLMDSAGGTLNEDDDAGAGANFQIVQNVTPGTYYIRVTHYDDTQTGAYSLVCSLGGSGVLTLTPTTATASPAGEGLFFNVTANVVWTWSVDVGWITSAEAASQSGNQTFNYTAAAHPGGATRTAVITLTSGALTATHTITQMAAAADDHGNDIATATLISETSTTAGQIETGGDNDFFRINVTTSGLLTVQSASTVDTYGYLLDSAGGQLVYDDDSGPGSNFLFSRAVTAGTTYYVRVRNYSTATTGGYDLVCNLAQSQPDDHGDTTAEATVVAPNSLTAGQIGAPGDHDYFRVVLTAPGTLTVQTMGTMDSFGYLLDAAGVEIESDDDDGDGANFYITRSLAAGTYYVRVQHYSAGGIGSYELVCSLAQEGIAAGPVTNPANGHVYYLLNTDTWTASEAKAVAMGGHLVTINDVDEQAWVMTSFGSYGSLWLGLNDAQAEGIRTWVSGETPAYSNWRAGEPNGGAPDEDYVMAYWTNFGLDWAGLWNDINDVGDVVGYTPLGVVEIAPPVIDTQPASQTIAAGTSAALTVVASGGALFYQWYQGAAGVTTTPLGTNSASFTTPVLAVSTSFWVRVTNAHGLHTDSQAAMITTEVGPEPEIALRSPTGSLLTHNGTWSFSGVGTSADRTLTFTIENTGGGPLQITNIEVIGANAGFFTITSMPETPVPAADSTQFIVKYAPTTTGDHQATVRITSNDTDEGVFDLLVAGKGVNARMLTLGTQLPTDVIFTEMTLRGSVNTEGTEPALFFDYGTTPAMTSSIAATPPVALDLFTSATARLTGLRQHTTYYFRLRATGPGGTSYGNMVSVNLLNSFPMVQDDNFEVIPGSAVPLNVQENDIDPGDPLTIATYTNPPASQGKLTKVNGGLVFAAAATFTGTTFTYTVKDPVGALSSAATVTLTKGTATLDPPSAQVSSAATSYDVGVTTNAFWSVSENLTWVTASPATSAGDGSVTLTLMGNTSKTSRTGTVTIAGKPHVITQMGVLAPALSLPPEIPPAIVGGYYHLEIPTLNGPVTYTVTNLPPGLAVDHNLGVIRGRPTKAGAYAVKVAGRNAAGVAPSPLAFTISVAAMPGNLVGVFHGYIESNEALNGNIGSRFELTTTGSGGVSGKIITGTTSLPLAGGLDLMPEDPSHPTCTLLVRRTATTPPEFQLSLNFDAAANSVSCQLQPAVDAPPHDSVVVFDAWRNPWTKTLAPGAYKGLHTFYVQPDHFELPTGYGYGSFTVNATTGALTVGGKLPDGSTLATITFIGPAGQVLIYTPLYGSKGAFGGRLDMDITHELFGNCRWYKPATGNARETLYKDGFGPGECSAYGGAFPVTPSGGVIMGLPNTNNNAYLEFTTDPTYYNESFGILFSLRNLAATGTVNKATFPTLNPNKVTMTTVNPATGAFGGDFTLTFTGFDKPQLRKVSYLGQVVRFGGITRGYGYFLLPETAAPPQTTATTPKHAGQVLLTAP